MKHKKFNLEIYENLSNLKKIFLKIVKNNKIIGVLSFIIHFFVLIFYLSAHLIKKKKTYI